MRFMRGSGRFQPPTIQRYPQDYVRKAFARLPYRPQEIGNAARQHKKIPTFAIEAAFSAPPHWEAVRNRDQGFGGNGDGDHRAEVWLACQSEY
jgi:hypothetical protein